MSVITCRLRYFLYVLLAVIIFLLLVLAAGFYIVQREPQALVQGHLASLAKRTGLSISFGTLDIALLPLPTLAVSDLVVEDDARRFSVGYATVSPDYLSLLLGQIKPRDIVFLRPRYEGALPSGVSLSAGLDLPALTGNLQEGDEDGLPSLPVGCRLRVMDGDISLQGQDGLELELGSLHCDLTVTGPSSLRGDLGWHRVTLSQGKQLLASLERFQLAGQGDLLRPQTGVPSLHMTGRWHVPSWLDSLDMDLHLQSDAGGWAARAGLSGELLKDGEALPLSLQGRYSAQAGQDHIDLKQIDMSLGADSARLDGRLRLPWAAQGFRLEGDLRVHRLSLTQWLGFARNLAPGLQLALDNITDGILEFQADGQGLSVPHIEAHCTGTRFTGSGGVASWAAPVVALDLRAAHVDLGLAIPESVGESPSGPHFFHGPLTPLPDTPLAPGEVGIGYDIRLSADKIAYGPLMIHNGGVVISHGKEIKNGFRDCHIDAQGLFYGGKLQGECILSGEKDLRYAISLQARGIDGAPLARDMPVLPIRKGRYEAEVSIQSQGKELDHFLAKLNGRAKVRAQNGSLGLPDSKTGLAFKSMDAELRLRTAAWRKQRLGLDGQWSARLETREFVSQLRLGGRLWFGEGQGRQGPVSFNALPGKGDLLLQPQGSLAKPVRIELQGMFGCQGQQVEGADIQLNALGMKLTGWAKVSMEKRGLLWQGSIKGTCPDMHASLNYIGLAAVKLPKRLKSLSWQADLKGSPKSLRLDSLAAHVDESNIRGSLAVTFQETPSWVFDIELDKLDLSRYLSDARPDVQRADSKKAQEKKWDFAFLQTFDAEGLLRIRELRGWHVRVQDVRLPFKFRQGLLSIDPHSARLYGAALQGNSQIDFRHGLRFTTKCAVKNFDLAEASADMGSAAALTGRASLDLHFHAVLTGPGQMPAALDGLWSFSAGKGSYQARNSKGRPKGSPTHFTLVSASGDFQRGICRSGDLKLQGPDLYIRGGAMADLNTRMLEGDLTVDMGRFKNIPVHLHGDLDKPETSIGAGRLFFVAIGGLMQGFIDVIGGILEGTWKIFR